LAALFVLFGASTALAGSEIYDGTNTCQQVNCAAVVLGGTIASFPPMPGRWSLEVRAAANECVRLDVTSQFPDLEMLVIGPAGRIYRSDDRGGDFCALCPLVKISPAMTGEYTVSLTTQNGALTEGNFTLSYGRYDAGNANCDDPTPATGASASADTAPAAGASVAP
jgi:hypothetical protein